MQQFIRKNLLLFIPLVIILLTIPLAIYLAKTRQIIRKKAAASATLRVFPQQKTAEPNIQFNINLEFNSGEARIGNIHAVLTFNPQILQVNSITSHRDFPQFFPGRRAQLTGFDNSAGVIDFIILSGPNEPSSGINQFREAAIISLTGQNLGTSSLNFDNSSGQTSITESGGENIYDGNGLNGTYTVAQPSPTPTITNTPTPTPTSSPTPTPTITPTRSPTPSPTPGEIIFKFRISYDRATGQNYDPPRLNTLDNVTVALKNLAGQVVADRQIRVNHATDLTCPFDDYGCPPVYEGEADFTNFEGTHDVLVRGPAHLQRNMGRIQLRNGATTECLEEKSPQDPQLPTAGPVCFYWFLESKPLLGGNAVDTTESFNIIDTLYDLEAWRTAYYHPETGLHNADFNLNGVLDVDLTDLEIWRYNYYHNSTGEN